jgi:hypothetical protein
MSPETRNILYTACIVITLTFFISILNDAMAVFYLVLLFVILIVFNVLLRRHNRKIVVDQEVEEEENPIVFEKKRKEYSSFVEQYENERLAFSEQVQNSFPIPFCPRCGNIDFKINEFNPHYTGVKLCCSHCEKRFWVIDPVTEHNDLKKLYTTHLAKYNEIRIREFHLFGSHNFNNTLTVSTSLSDKKVKKVRRTTIPKNVKMEVWQRDNGKCVQCGSNENLEYDHIIPFSRGGANTTRNLQLLCESCNRSKGAKIE